MKKTFVFHSISGLILTATESVLRIFVFLFSFLFLASPVIGAFPKNDSLNKKCKKALKQQRIQGQLQDHLRLTEELACAIPLLKSNRYLEKKTKLIRQANAAIYFSSQVPSSQLTQICHPAREGKLLHPSIGVYKKGRSVWKEALVWDLSVLLRCDQWIAPSLATHLYNAPATFQPFIPSLNKLPRFLTDCFHLDIGMSLVDFWKLTIFSFLVGFTDLNGDNLSYDKNQFFLVDNDCSFPESHDISIASSSFHIPLVNALADLEQAYLPLDEDQSQQINLFLNFLTCAKHDIEALLNSPLASIINEKERQAFWKRFDLLTQSPITTCATLDQFSRGRFPQYYKIASEIKSMIHDMIGAHFGPFSLNHMIGDCLPWLSNFSPEQKEQITNVVASIMDM